MAPLAEQLAVVAKRADGCGAYAYRGADGFCYYSSAWYWWGRWVFAGLAVLFILLVFLALFRNSRRRRKMGQQPLYGTGWMAPAPPPPYYPPPPQYAAQDPNAYKMGSYYSGQPQGEYSGQQQGVSQEVPVQPPANTYQPAGPSHQTDYAPPPGPPPSHLGK
ncbi:hypothetical protein VTJ83DRAFT_655 [Remersonia thermophila]|uniref:Uncharacterized protein n=1 Tax=Remersonia thermophila TaxID=72144 RepID=A0ABR4DLL2_9PEZI